MKTLRNLFAALTAVILLLLPSCGKEDEDDDIIEWDIYPVVAQMHIVDASGNNLLDPSVAGNLFGKKIVAEYDGKEYELVWKQTDKTKAYMPQFTGLTIKYEYVEVGDKFEQDPAKAYLAFGEFDGAVNQDISLTLRIEGYAETWDIDMTHRIKWKGNSPEITNSALLNGIEVPYDKITITL